MTGWDEPGFGRQSGWVHPSWMGNDQVLVSTPSEPLNLSVMFDRIGTDNNDIQNWFSDDNAPDMRDGEMNRQGTMMAFVTGDSRRITFYRTTATRSTRSRARRGRPRGTASRLPSGPRTGR
jgi:hypothetical protein